MNATARAARSAATSGPPTVETRSSRRRRSMVTPVLPTPFTLNGKDVVRKIQASPLILIVFGMCYPTDYDLPQGTRTIEHRPNKAAPFNRQ
jgi:hypothetical protein